MTLTEFIDEGIRLSTERGARPHAFIKMRETHGLVTAIRLCVDRGASGLETARKIGLLDWSLEAAVLQFPDDFSSTTQRHAKERLEWKPDA
jgi:hypothetical protein